MPPDARSSLGQRTEPSVNSPPLPAKATAWRVLGLKSNVDELSRLEKKECFFESRRWEPGPRREKQHKPKESIIDDHHHGSGGSWSGRAKGGRPRR